MRRFGDDFMKRKGFTLIEITISMVLLLTLMGSAYSLLSTAVKMNANFRAEKELVENAPLLQSFLEKEFERAMRVDEVLDKDGVLHTELNHIPVDARCIKLTRSKHSLLQSAEGSTLYINQLIYLREDDRKSVWSVKNSNKLAQISAKNYKGGYEVGVHVDSILLSKVEEDIYNVELIFKYYQTKFEYKTSFFVKMQK